MATQLQQSINAAPTMSLTIGLSADEIIAQNKANRELANKTNWSNDESNDNYTWNSQPYKFGKPIGNAGYHWLKNIHGADGEYYAVYQPNRGGENRKLYNLITEAWESKYIKEQMCTTCVVDYDAVRPGINKCPNCQAEVEYIY